jgi:hypothetical protein
MLIGRRHLLVSGLALAARADGFAPSSKFLSMCRHPLLTQRLYRFSPGGQVAADGAQGRNRGGIWQIEEQSVGGEYVMRGVISNRAEWRETGWRILDWGNRQQESSGRYKSRGAHYHSMALFLSGLEVACMADPASATAERLGHLRAGARWMAANMQEGLSLNAGLTHRSFLCMSVLGCAVHITGDRSLLAATYTWAEQGLAAQRPNGINPECGNFDVSYQMVGPEAALIYLPVCDDIVLRRRLRRMCRLAIAWWETRLNPDGSVNGNGSTRIGHEHNVDGSTKTVNYKDAFQTLVWAGEMLPDTKLFAVAARLASHLR